MRQNFMIFSTDFHCDFPHHSVFLFSNPFLLGRSWKASELRLKSWDDLHKLWYVLLKEKNMLMTQRQMLQAQNLRFPNPERLPKVFLHILHLV